MTVETEVTASYRRDGVSGDIVKTVAIVWSDSRYCRDSGRLEIETVETVQTVESGSQETGKTVKTVGTAME